MLFFLKYTKAEDLGMAHSEFRKQRGRLHQDVARYLARAELEYPPGAELVRIADAQGGSLEGAGVEAVLEEILRPSGGRADKLGVFREIFYQWALVGKVGGAGGQLIPRTDEYLPLMVRNRMTLGLPTVVPVRNRRSFRKYGARGADDPSKSGVYEAISAGDRPLPSGFSGILLPPGRSSIELPSSVSPR